MEGRSSGLASGPIATLPFESDQRQNKANHASSPRCGDTVMDVDELLGEGGEDGEPLHKRQRTSGGGNDDVEPPPRPQQQIPEAAVRCEQKQQDEPASASGPGEAPSGHDIVKAETKAEPEGGPVAQAIAPRDAGELRTSVGAYTQREEYLIKQEGEGEIKFCYVENDGSDQNMIYLTGLKNIFSKQLPNMPKVCRARANLHACMCGRMACECPVRAHGKRRGKRMFDCMHGD